MYSASSVPVDKGLGFDFSGISDLVKSAATAGLNIYQNQLQVKQIQAMAKAGQPYVAQSPSVYGQPYNILPMSQVLQPSPTFGGQYVAPPSQGMGTGTMVMIGLGLVGVLAAFKVLAK